MKNKKRLGFLLVCLLPTFILFCFFIIYPTIQVFLKSMYNYSAFGGGSEFIGLKNYTDMLNDGIFLKALINTGILMLIVPVATLFLSLVLAFILSNGRLREKDLYRTIFFFPSILSFVVIGILWSFIYHPNMGILNSALKFIGLDKLALTWLGNPETVLWAIAVTMIWQATGYYMIMYLAGMDSIPKELYEAASMDGATATKQFFKITIPMLWEIIRVTIIFSIKGVLVISFVIVTVMTAGGPNNSSQVVMTYMYQQAFVNANFGYAMAITVTVFIISIFLSFLSNKLTERDT
ncbi:sugar ABC transporter permease [Virgibacillus necropolis]|uniref:carbohydrate ABC transporter permease n=1 Tax=Virgibacillus necropolis TaxID=163877 RepID=UPI00384E21E4